MRFNSGNIGLMPNLSMKKGQVVHGHKHNYDHTTFLLSGAISVRTVVDGIETVTEYWPPNRYFLVKANVEHELTALVDNTEFWCVYSHRDAAGHVIQTDEGWEKSYV